MENTTVLVLGETVQFGTRGKRGKRGPSDWNKKVMAQWAKMKPKGHSFSDALKETSRLRKAGLI